MKKVQEHSAEDAFIREIDEEIKNDRIKKLWDQYGLFIILFVIVAVSAAVSYETFKSWNEKRNQQYSNSYAYALNLQNQGRYAESLEVLEQMKKADNGVYSDVAEIQIANILVDQGKTDEAVKILEEVVNKKSFNKQMRDVAVIKLASYKLDTAPGEEIRALIAPYAESENSWTNIARELLAMLAVRDADFAQAKKLYNDIANSASATESLKARAKDMLATLNEVPEKQ